MRNDINDVIVRGVKKLEEELSSIKQQILDVLPTLTSTFSEQQANEYRGKELDYFSNSYYKDGTSVMVFLDKGFIFVGNLYRESQDIFRLENCYNCRSQSTGKGWGYVAKNGKEYCTLDSYTSEPIKFSRDEIKLITEIQKEKWFEDKE